MRRGVLTLTIVTVCAFLLADTINAFLERALVSPTLPAATAVEPTKVPDRPIDLSALSQEILQSNLFAPPPTGSSPNGRGPASSAPLDAAKKIKLMGTVMGEGIGASAVVQNLSNERQTLYHLHEQIPDLGAISEIRADGILIRNGTQEEELQLAGLTRRFALNSPVRGTPSLAETEENDENPIRRADARPSSPPKPNGYQSRMTLDRRAIAADAETLTHDRQVRFDPVSREGKAEGIRIQFFQVGGLIDKLGLSFGDVIQGVNGARINDVPMLVKQFRMLKDERSFSLDMVRNGEKRTLSYEIR